MPFDPYKYAVDDLAGFDPMKYALLEEEEEEGEEGEFGSLFGIPGVRLKEQVPLVDAVLGLLGSPAEAIPQFPAGFQPAEQVSTQVATPPFVPPSPPLMRATTPEEVTAGPFGPPKLRAETEEVPQIPAILRAPLAGEMEDVYPSGRLPELKEPPPTPLFEGINKKIQSELATKGEDEATNAIKDVVSFIYNIPGFIGSIGPAAMDVLAQTRTPEETIRGVVDPLEKMAMETIVDPLADLAWMAYYQANPLEYKGEKEKYEEKIEELSKSPARPVIAAIIGKGVFHQLKGIPKAKFAAKLKETTSYLKAKVKPQEVPERIFPKAPEHAGVPEVTIEQMLGIEKPKVKPMVKKPPPPAPAGKPAPTGKAKPAAKQPWEMTREEYIPRWEKEAKINRGRGEAERLANSRVAKASHKARVKRALSEGKLTPKHPRYAEIMAEYPELAKKGRKVRVTRKKVDKITTALESAEQRAYERIRKRGTRLTAGIDPAEIVDLGIIGAAKIGRGVVKFADWSAEMVREFGDRIKPHLKAIYARSQEGTSRYKANAELDSFIDYYKSIQAPKEFRPPRKPARVEIKERLREEGLRGKELTAATNAEFIKATQDYGIALRQTKTGKVQPAIREAGTFVPKDFATYKEFKDAKSGVFGGTKDATRFIQEIDGALSVEAKAKLSGQGGPAERYVLHRTRDMVKSKLSWTNTMKSRLAEISKGLSKEQTKIANRVIAHISREGAYIDPAKLVTNPKISVITKDVKVIRLAQEGRKLYESLLRHQNELRRLRGQKEIPHRDYYTAHSIHETTIWERALGHNKTPEQIVGPGLPDYIKPNAPFNPRAMARELGMPETVREMNLSMLLERYIETAAKDIFNTSIVQNNKAFIQQLESMGYRHAARGLENWTAEAFGGVKSAVDRAANLSPTVHKGMSRFRQGLIRSVFPLNFAWNSFVQTSSGVLTVTRYGVRNSVKGLYDWFGSKKIRQEIRDNAYSAIIKSQRSGRISRQDINRGVGVAERLNRGKLEKVSDAANFFTEWVERHLTGWSVATAKRHGASAGLKGKALWEYASDGGAKTQSMYNLEDLPGMLRSEVVKTAAPFQTFSFEIFNTLREAAGKTGTPPATAAIRIKMMLRFLAGATAVNYIGQAAIGRKPWELSSFIPFYGTFIAPISTALRGEDVSMATTRGLPSPIGIAIKGGQALHKGLLRPGFAAGKELVRTRNFKATLEEFMATGKWDKLRRFTIRYLSGFAGLPGGTQMNRVVDGLIAVSAGGMVDSTDKLMFPITDTKDKMRTFLAGPWASEGGQEYWDKRGGELNVDIEFMEEHPLLRDVAESIPVVGDFYKFRKDSESQTRKSIRGMIRTGNTDAANDKRLEWNAENPDDMISEKWYYKLLLEAAE